MGIKAKLMDSGAMDRALTRLSHEIVEKNGGTLFFSREKSKTFTG